VARTLIVECEAGARVPHFAHAAPARDEAHLARLGSRGVRSGLAVDRRERILREQVLHVGEDQLLVLLLVVRAELDHVAQRRALLLVLEQPQEMSVDVLAIGVHLRERRAREQPALRPRILRSNAVVVRVEQHAERRLERAVARQRRLECERLEVPARVREVPLRGARVGHRLERAVLGGKRRGEC
jgi:hypothetical protein